MIYGRWVLEWMTLLQRRTATEARGSKCRYVLSLYVIFVAEYGFVSQFVEGGTFIVEHCFSMKMGTNSVESKTVKRIVAICVGL